MVLKGCVQCVKIENICFENSSKCILVDAHAVGVTLTFDSIWNFDSRPEGPPEVFRVEAAEGTLRRQFGSNIERNIVHGSDGPDTAVFEIGYFFPAVELAQRAIPRKQV